MSTKFRIIFLAIFLSGCTDLSAVRDWSATSMEAAQFNQVVATYADTPRRLAFYDKGGATLWKAQATIRTAQANALELQLSLVADYMAALSALSADGVTDYTNDSGTLTGSLEKTGQVSETTLGAAGKLAATIANAAARNWQKRKVGEFVEKANPHLQNLLNAELRSIVDKDFRRDLKVEAQILNRHFKGLLRTGGGSAAANAALNEWFIHRKTENARRLAAVDAYVTILAKISDGHQKLFDNRNDLDAMRLAKDLFKLAKEIRINVKKIIKA